MRHLLNQTFTHKRPMKAEGPAGGWTETWQTLGAVRGRLRAANVQERFIGATTKVAVDYVFYCMPDADVRRDDRIELGELKARIVAVKDLAGHHLECEAVTDTRP